MQYHPDAIVFPANIARPMFAKITLTSGEARFTEVVETADELKTATVALLAEHASTAVLPLTVAFQPGMLLCTIPEHMMSPGEIAVRNAGHDDYDAPRNQYGDRVPF